MAKRVAITIAGAVSLGSYEAGVTYELLEAIRTHNEAADKAGNPDGKIYVDVITGASAGGMTAAMLAQWLMFRGDTMKDAATNPLYRAWVKRISLKGLVRLQKGENKWHSLFSSNLIADIGAEMLVNPMTQEPVTGAHACLEPGAPLRVGIALTNLNGIDYMIPIEGSLEEGFNYTRSVDQRLFTVKPGQTNGPVMVTPDGAESKAKWEDLRDVAVACGAFPFAFRPRQIERVAEEYVNTITPLWPGSAAQAKAGTTYVTPSPDQPWSFAYTDGGVLQNQPLGVAKDLVDARVQERLAPARAHMKHARAMLGLAEQRSAEKTLKHVHCDADDRIYVFISPNEVRSSVADRRADAISLSKMLPDLADVYFRQAAFHDWIMAETVNQKIRLLDQRAKDLQQALAGGRIADVAGFSKAADNLDDLLLQKGKAEAFERLRYQYSELYDELHAMPAQGPALATTFLQGIAAMEAAAHLDDRDKMHIVAVLADGKKELAGSGLSAFVGFFSETFRQHDYEVGRSKARAYLLRSDVVGLLGLDAAALDAGYRANPLPDPAALVKVPLSLLQQLKAGGFWLLYGLWIRAWKLLAVLLVVVLAYGAAAHYEHWWPF